MKLTHIRIKDFRSFSGEHDFDVSSGVNYFVGPNNCGKSNLVRALELALDPDTQYDPEIDRPAGSTGAGKPPTTRITLTFQVGTSSPEKTLLARAKDYELGIRHNRRGSETGKIRTYAAAREVRLVASFAGSGARKTGFQAKGLGAASMPVDSPEHQKLENQFRSVVRLAVVHSGEDLESLLKGKFRAILQLVIADHLGEELERSVRARDDYLTVLRNELLEPLRQRVLDQVGDTFPEITVADLVPSVPTVEETLSSVDVQLGDVITTDLADKGTGLRGAVLVSMLQYLAEQSRRSLVLAVEEPEAFLHPAAQEGIGRQLEELADRGDVSLVVTTHSPHVISRRPDARVTRLQKRTDGTTGLAASVVGNDRRAELLGSLYRDAGLASVLERALEVPAGSRAVLVTEGYTDGEFLRIACEVANRPDLLDGIHVIPAGGATKVVLHSVLAKSATQLPVLALLDADDNGRSARSKLEDFGWSRTRDIVSLAEWPGKCRHSHDVEIESLIPADICGLVVSEVGESDAVTAKRACNGNWHFEYTDAWKSAALMLLPNLLKVGETSDLIWLAELINGRVSSLSEAQARRSARVR